MKTISMSMLNYLSTPVLTLPVLVLIERTDGVVLGFTSWDQSIVYDGNTYLPAISMSPSAVKVNADLSTDQMDIIGAIDSTYLIDEDIDGGRYDLAKITVMRINPYQIGWGVIIDLTGTMGQINYGDGSFNAAINSLGFNLNQNVGDIITPLCRVQQLGDSQCKKDLTTFRHANTVSTVLTDNRTLTFADSNITTYYDYGMVYFNSAGSGGGNNFNLSMEIKTSTQASGIMTIILQEPMPFPVVTGDAVILEAGCDRRPITCRSKFNNLVNIHADPYVPGNDYLLAVGRPPS